MGKYIPMDLTFEHYLKLKQHLNVSEYQKICDEMKNPRYCPVMASEALKLHDRGTLALSDKVRVIWIHDVERPADNYLAKEMADMEHQYGFHSTYNIRVCSAVTSELRTELNDIIKLGHEIQYQYEDLVITQGDIAAARKSFSENLAFLRQYYPGISLSFAHGVYKSGFNSTDIFKENNQWCAEKLLMEYGLHRHGELYYFMSILKNELGDKFHCFAEGTYIGGDEFTKALRSTKPGDVAVFLQHPPWWSDLFNMEDLIHLMRKSSFFN